MSAPKTQRWHEDDVQNASTDDVAQCAMFRGSWLFGVEQCDGAGSHLIRQACVHEHVHDIRVCEECARNLQRIPMFCNECTDGSESHWCPITIAVVEVVS